jgi:DNA-binding SARP family transcriptional activator
VPGLTSAKSQALLFYLAVTGRVHTRPALAALLWGDLTDSAARANLRKALHELRQKMSPYLVIERDLVALAEDADCWVDTVEFEALLRATLPADTDGALRAAELYRGDFLEGFYVRNAPDFEDWWLTERGRLRDLMLEGLQALANHYDREGRLDEAMAATRRLLELEPWREAAHRRLMTWLALSGQRSSALAQYEVCRRILADELAVEPAEETRALYDRIRGGDLAPISTPKIDRLEIEPRMPAFLKPEAEIDACPRVPFVGRDPQLRRLGGFLERALAGRGQVVLVSGEAGWGKTRLLAEFSHRAQEKQPDLIAASGICTALTEAGDPYLPFREILRMLSADVEQGWAAGSITQCHAMRLWDTLPGVVEALLRHGRQLLGPFVPAQALLERAAAHGSIGPDLLQQLQAAITRRQTRHQDDGVDQERIFGQVAAVMQAVAKVQPLLLILDDLHWADSASLGLLFHLSRRIANSRILILGAYRPEDVSLDGEVSEQPLASILAELKRLSGDILVELGQEQGDGRQFVDALLDTEPNRLSEAFRARMAQYTKGHPLFALEMLRDMKEQEHLSQDEEGFWVESPAITWNTLPQRVEGVIERRLNRLDPELRKTLVAASVEGEEFTAEVVARVCRVAEAKMVGLLSQELARKHHLVRASGVGRLGKRRISRYQFSHNLFQKYLYDGLDPVERAYLHEDVGRALERLYEDHSGEVALQLARHFQEAGHLGKATAYLQQAGDAAAQVHANAEAITHYRLALVLAQENRAEMGTLAALYMRLGRALELDSQFAPALAVYEELGRLARQQGDRTRELNSLMAQVTIQAVPTAIHDPGRARTLGEGALDLARELGDGAAEAKILWSLALAYFFDHDLARAIESGERSLALAREQNLREQMAQTLNDLGSFLYLYSGQIEKSREALREADQLWRELDNLPMLADSLASLATAQVLAGEFGEATVLSEHAYGISLSIGNLWGQSYSGWKIGLAHWERGNISLAISTMEESIRLAETASFLPPQTNTRAELAALYGELGAVDQGRELARVALQIAEAQNPAQVGHDLGVLARLLLRAGDTAGAQAAVDRAVTDPHRASWRVMFHPVVFAEAELALERRDWEQALGLIEPFLEELRHCGLRLRVPLALYVQAQALQGLGQDGAARERLLEARAEAEAIGSRWTLWRILVALSQLETDREQSKQLQRQARDVVEAIAGQIKQADLRASFLNLPEVRTALEGVGAE